MNEPQSRQGEASQTSSNSHTPRRTPLDWRRTDGMPGIATFQQAGTMPDDRPQRLYPQSQHNPTDPSSIPDLTPCPTSSPSQALQQLSNTLRLQSLAIKSREGGSSANAMLHSHAVQPMEADELEEDVTNDPIFQKYQLHRLSRASRNLASAPSPTKPPSSPLVIEPDSSQGTAAPSSHGGYITPDLGYIADSMNTDDGFNESAVLLAMDHQQRQYQRRPYQHSMTGARGDGHDGDTLYFRRSVHAALRCPVVVHKAARMRKRTKSAMKSASLPKDGEKGRLVKEELEQTAASVK